MTTLLLSDVHPNPNQPRKTFEAGALEELATSIRAAGLMQPITVRPRPEGGYEIVAGERRWRAHCLLAERGHLEPAVIEANVREMDEDTRDIQAIVENMARRDVTPLEEAHAFQRMLDKGWSVEKLAESLGIKQPRRITDRTRLLNLSEGIQHLAARGHISWNMAYDLSKLPQADQHRVMKSISAGTIKGDRAVSAAVEAILDEISQDDFFGEQKQATEADVKTVNAMEAKIDRLEMLAASGWSKGEVVIAQRVSRDRATLIADKLAAIQKALRIMENDLRRAGAQAALLLDGHHGEAA
jgi:ParB family chromosome partitioning protein